MIPDHHMIFLNCYSEFNNFWTSSFHLRAQNPKVILCTPTKLYFWTCTSSQLSDDNEIFTGSPWTLETTIWWVLWYLNNLFAQNLRMYPIFTHYFSFFIIQNLPGSKMKTIRSNCTKLTVEFPHMENIIQYQYDKNLIN